MTKLGICHPKKERMKESFHTEERNFRPRVYSQFGPNPKKRKKERKKEGKNLSYGIGSAHQTGKEEKTNESKKKRTKEKRWT